MNNPNRNSTTNLRHLFFLHLFIVYLTRQAPDIDMLTTCHSITLCFALEFLVLLSGTCDSLPNLSAWIAALPKIPTHTFLLFRKGGDADRCVLLFTAVYSLIF